MHRPDVRTQQAPLRLGFGLGFEDLHRREGLERLDAAFRGWLASRDAPLAGRLDDARRSAALPDASALPPREEAALLLDLGAHLDAFIGALFGIADELADLHAAHEALAPLIRVKWKFVKRQALLEHTAETLAGFDGAAARTEIERWLGEPFEELAFARAVLAWQAAEREGAAAQPPPADRLALARRFCAWAALTEPGQQAHGDGVLFRHPGKVDPSNLLGHARSSVENGVRVHVIRPEHIRRRDGFSLTDPGTGLRGALDEANYCIWCHHQGKDSCSKGFREKTEAGQPPRFRRNAFGTPMTGCPLEERISEFHELKSKGHPVAALAVIVVDNPMVAATGHRICNECMKACIYQKQTPVDIPQAETRTLKDVLALPWGFEVYSLLTRWNPLNLRRPLPAPDSGRKVLVAGLGPAGFTLAHHLMNDGHSVFAVDGLKIEPLPARLSGVDAHGGRAPFDPIEDIESLHQDLSERVMAGFGGVAEYGITVRWDKNFLGIIRLLLERREAFAMAGGVRFGGTIDVDSAFELGFDHIALAIGAGRPTTLDLPNGLASGVRTASDFLMALQLTGAAKQDSVANMQLRLPVIVIGGGLTAIDAATESLAYYVVQVEKFLARHESLARDLGEDRIRERRSAQEREVADEFLAHAREIREERARASAEGRAPRIVELLQRWGGATVAYRRRLLDSPSYTLNHEEVGKALEEGIRFAECLRPERLEVDAGGAVRSVVLRRQMADDDGRWRDGDAIEWPARTVLVAAGTQPNTVLAREAPAHFALDGRHFQAVDETGAPVRPDAGNPKPDDARVLLGRAPDGRMMSFFGDLHPSFAGNVVKAMASARQGHATVSRVLANRPPASAEDFGTFSARIGDLLRATVYRVERLTHDIVEVVVRAPLAARRFEPGQFYRLQNFESLAPVVEADGMRTRLAMEGLALTGAWVDREQGLVSMIVLEIGGSSRLCASLRPGEPVVLMGPTGAPTEIVGGQTVVLVGGGLGNAVLFSIGAALRARGSRVLYFAGYRKAVDRYKVAEIEAAADAVVWCCDEAPGFAPGRPQDRSAVGNIVQVMERYATDALGAQPIALQDADRLITIGSDRMMAAVAAARHDRLAPFLKRTHVAIGSINSPMQCMLKEICAQCLQLQRDPQTGETRHVFSCFEQDQPLDRVDFPALTQRLGQNAAQENLTTLWVARCLAADGQA